MSAEGLGLLVRDGRDGALAVLDTWRDEVRVELDLPDGRWLEVPARIAWRRTDDDDGGPQLRMGLEFLGTDAEDMRELAAYIG